MPCIALCGCLGDGAEALLDVGVTQVVALADAPTPEAIASTEQNLRRAIRNTMFPNEGVSPNGGILQV